MKYFVFILLCFWCAQVNAQVFDSTRYLNIRQLCIEKKFEEAVDSCTKIINHSSKDYRYFNLRGYAFLHSGKMKEAKKDLDYGLLLNSTDSFLLYNRANWFYNKEKYNLALKDLQAAGHNRTYRGADYSFMAACNYAMDQYRKAYALINMAIYKEPNTASPSYYRLRGEILFQLDSLDGAERDSRFALQLNDEVCDAYFTLGQVMYEKEDFIQSIEFMNKYLECDSTDSFAYYHLAYAYYDSKQYAKAAQNFETYIQYDQTDDEVYFRRGVALARLGTHNAAEALDMFNKSILLNPKESDAYYNRSIIHDFYDNKVAAYADSVRAQELQIESEQAE